MNRLYLKVPRLEEMSYRQSLLSNPETMSYNKGYDIPIKNYNKENGCIDFSEHKWKSWFNSWINNEPLKYYAYIIRKEDDSPIGEVNLYYNEKKKWYDMGIVIEAKFRGLGYSVEALNLLVKYAFEKLDVDVLHNYFESHRETSKKTHEAAGFKVVKIQNEIYHYIITKEDYFKSIK